MGRYRALSPLAEAFIGDFATGEFEHDFPSPAAERDAVQGGLVEIVPRTYRALSDNYRVPQGETFADAFPVEIEAALTAGGHIERVEPDDEKPSRKRSKRADAESPDQPSETTE